MLDLYPITLPLFCVLKWQADGEAPYQVADFKVSLAEASDDLDEAMREADSAVSIHIEDGVQTGREWLDLPFICRVIRLDLSSGQSADVTLDAISAIDRWNRQRSGLVWTSPALEALRQYIQHHPARPVAREAPAPAVALAPQMEMETR